MRSSLSKMALLMVLLTMPVLIPLRAAQAEDLKITKNISVNGSNLTSDTYIKGARERIVMTLPGGTSNVNIRQCDLKRSLTLNDKTQTYMVTEDPDNDDARDAASFLTGTPAAQQGGKITMTSTVTDTGERKQLFGYQARHLKTRLQSESSPNACSAVHQTIEMDGWYASIAGETAAACTPAAPPIRQGESCHDRVVMQTKGKAKAGFPLEETITIENGDAQPVTMTVNVSNVSKQALTADLFDPPTGYRQVSSVAELYGAPQVAPSATPAPVASSAASMGSAAGSYVGPSVAAAAAPTVTKSRGMGLSSLMNMRSGAMGMPGAGGSMGMPGAAPAGGVQVAAPQPVGPKAPGKMRIGVVSPDAQMGQGSNSGMDYSTPIRNAMVQLMNGPAVEVIALDARIPMQIQAEGQQKQCDYLLYSTVAVKAGTKSGFGKLMKMAGPATSMVPMVGMMRGAGAMTAAASMATSAAAQSAAMNSLASFNGQIKSRDEITMAYQLVQAGQQSPKLSDTLNAKAASDGDDVLSPMIQLVANKVLTEAVKK